MGRNWRYDLQDFLHSYRATPHSITKFSPSELMFGWNIRDKIPGNSRPVNETEARENDRKAKEKGRMYADSKRRAKQCNIDVGDYVIVKNFVKKNKLTTTFNPEPHLVIQRDGSRLHLKNIKSSVISNRHVNHTKRILNANPMMKQENDADNHKTSEGTQEEDDMGPAIPTAAERTTNPTEQPSTSQTTTEPQMVSRCDGRKRPFETSRATSKRSKHVPKYLADYKL